MEREIDVASARQRYVPRAGGVAEAALRYLRNHRGKIDQDVLADACEVEADQLAASLTMAERMNAVAHDRHNGVVRWFLWSDPADSIVINDSARPCEAAARTIATAANGDSAFDEISGLDLVGADAAIAEGSATTGCAVEPRLPEARANLQEKVERAEKATAGTTAVQDVSPKFACALFSDGRLIFEIAGQVALTLSVEQTAGALQVPGPDPTRLDRRTAVVCRCLASFPHKRRCGGN